MALVSGGRSTLNPDAPLFIPAAFRQVEDFSPEWWSLITSSTWYRNYWLSLHPDGFYDHAEDEVECDDVLDLLPDCIDLNAGDDFSSMETQFEEFIQFTEAEANKSSTPLACEGTDGKGIHGTDATQKNVNALNSLDVDGYRTRAHLVKYAEKPGKIMSPKYSPRCIQQPR